MNILSVNFNHDGSAVLLQDGQITGYVNTERFSRLKKHPGVRQRDIEELLEQARIRITEIDLVQLINLNTMDSPDIQILHGSNLKETWPDLWVDARFEKAKIVGSSLKCSIPREHHLFHAALAYYFSPFDSCVSFACDPVGAEAYFIDRGTFLPVAPQRDLTAPAVYAMVSELLFGSSLVGAGKLMALAPFGINDSRHPDYAALSKMTASEAYRVLVESTARDAIEVAEPGKSLNASLAWHTQCFLEFEIAQVLDELYSTARTFGIDTNLCLSGGVALNSVANQRCFERSSFTDLYMHPACGDDGTAIGAALLHWHHQLGQPKMKRTHGEAMYSVRSYEREIPEALRVNREKVYVRETQSYTSETAHLIAAGKVVGWYQGASEIGPRALGNRSILADPRNPRMKDHLNLIVKQRECFRPFAPSVLVESADEWFGIAESPFMLRVAPLKRDTVPAVTHVDGTARFQTVSGTDNPIYYQLISDFFELTNIPLLLNTSFNGKGEPIVETPFDAIDCMLRTRLDALVFPGLIVTARI